MLSQVSAALALPDQTALLLHCRLLAPAPGSAQHWDPSFRQQRALKLSLLTRTRCPANTVNVDLGQAGSVVVDDNLDCRNVQTSAAQQRRTEVGKRRFNTGSLNSCPLLSPQAPYSH